MAVYGTLHFQITKSCKDFPEQQQQRQQQAPTAMIVVKMRDSSIACLNGTTHNLSLWDYQTTADSLYTVQAQRRKNSLSPNEYVRTIK